ncbi:phenylalanine--tRNA ligase subunit beta [Mycoplasmopsis ciconiae]|uniref:Phenylalanine--tRNA ligase beta subunit n=1 Tax=Mycoplasmopsis ciconiae TaxID=561067 RepID=A0ABU7MLS5_9BACT|nr:phenylalanine--tRNA ligase subunit beta [Mycoplasmopsis ciconiae]
MLLSLKWLNKLIPSIKLDESVVKVINTLGFEVESFTKFSDVEGVLFGEIIELYKNPNSDNLTVAKVLSKNGEHIIQTTDTVLQVGDIVPFFPVGAKKGDLTFSAKKLKGIESQGMFAALEELGYNHKYVNNQGNHILRMPKDLVSIDTDAMDFLGLDDYILDISITANRNDANSYIIFAKELAAYYQCDVNLDLNLRKPDFQSQIVVDKNKASELSFLEVKLDKQPHEDFQTRLFLAKHEIDATLGYFVNLTNLTLLMTGATAHVYDANKISKNITCDYYSGQLEILGNKVVEVKDVLVIKDALKPISIASVMGLENSKVTDKTTHFIFEVGNFNNKDVRHAAKEIKINSNSSNQASRVITAEALILGMEFIYKNVQDFCQVSNFVNLPTQLVTKSIDFNADKLKIYSGLEELSVFDEAINKLKSLGFVFEDNKIIVPNYRYDVEFFEDIIEELFRFYKYDNFVAIQPNIKPLKTVKRDLTKEFFANNNFSEIRTFSLVSSQINKFNPFNFDNNVKLETFVSKEREEIRNSLITSFKEVVEYNQKRKISNINIFEEGMVNHNHFHIALASSTLNFVDLKRIILNYYKNDNLKFLPFSDNEFIHPNVSAKIYLNDMFIGWLGKLNPKYDTTQIYYAEFIKKDINPKINFKNINPEPLKTLDLTFSLKTKQNSNYIIEEINSIANVYQIQQIDEFVKDDIKNLTFRVYGYSEEIEKINNHFNK